MSSMGDSGDKAAARRDRGCRPTSSDEIPRDGRPTARICAVACNLRQMHFSAQRIAAASFGRVA